MCSSPNLNKYRDALEVLRKGRDMLVDDLADTVNDRAEDLLDSPFLLTELLENHGMKLQFLTLLMSQLEQFADDQPVDARFSDDVAFATSEGDNSSDSNPPRRKRSRRRGGRRRNRTSNANHAPDDIDR